ncbi:K02A2.6-like [Cordylochernes scorpioides]|uniref:RNA-directed DNA polymerase n=1 Tax=Cordylochernes scorpioides TaxID=51811 RepID=A0ABY6JY93_9ARAC|nr:K02A2.6-like [Cordylochernes scorpioides]
MLYSGQFSKGANDTSRPADDTSKPSDDTSKPADDALASDPDSSKGKAQGSQEVPEIAVEDSDERSAIEDSQPSEPRDVESSEVGASSDEEVRAQTKSPKAISSRVHCMKKEESSIDLEEEDIGRNEPSPASITFKAPETTDSKETDLTILGSFAREHCAKGIAFEQSNVIRTLGLGWIQSEDCFLCEVQSLEKTSATTTSEMLSFIAKLEDPLKWLAPVLVTGKLMVQRNTQGVKLYGFGDASEDTYAEAVYIRIPTDDGVSIRLLASKTKLAPMRKMSIPRLELCAALLLTRLENTSSNSVPAFQKELRRLTTLGSVERTSKIYGLTPFLDDQGILGVGGRLKWAPSMTYERKHPALLPSSGKVAQMIDQAVHMRTLHGSVHLMLSTLRQKYWILRAKDQERLTPGKPFSISGVDYAGPVDLRMSKGRGRKTEKGYICLVVCYVTRAVHLELFPDASTPTIMSAFKRVVARRGHCTRLYSDRGTSFVGAARQLRSRFYLAQNQLKELAAVMVNHLGRFVENLSEIVAPLNQLLVKGQDFVWDCSQERAFRKLKELLTTQTILAAYDVRKPTMVSPNASSYGLGVVLKQEGKNGTWRPVAYSSRTMTPTEKGYAQIEKEALSITGACERFQDFLLGKFGFKIVHIPGKELLDADALSRKPLLTTEGGENEQPTSAHINLVLSCITDKDQMLTKIFEAQQEDTTLKAVVNDLEQGWPVKKKMSQALLSYWHVKDELGVQNGLLMPSCRLVIPASMKLEILDKLHAGHFGIRKTRLRARETVWWPGISEEIAETVRKCSVCIQEAVSKHEPLIPTNFPTRPWQKIGVDFCKSIFARHGIPETVVSDNGTQFGSAREFAYFARQYEFTHVTSSPRFPQRGWQKQILPIAPENLNPWLVDSQTLKRKEGRRRKDMKSRYDRRCGATDREKHSKGDTVWITDMRIWEIVRHKASTPRSYMVDTPVGTVRRNRFHLRKGDTVQYPADPSTPTFSGEELVKNENTPVVDYPSNDSEDGQIRTRREGTSVVRAGDHTILIAPQRGVGLTKFVTSSTAMSSSRMAVPLNEAPYHTEASYKIRTLYNASIVLRTETSFLDARN